MTRSNIIRLSKTSTLKPFHVDCMRNNAYESFIHQCQDNHSFHAAIYTRSIGYKDIGCVAIAIVVVVAVVLAMLFARTFVAADPSPLDMLSCTCQ